MTLLHREFLMAIFILLAAMSTFAVDYSPPLPQKNLEGLSSLAGPFSDDTATDPVESPETELTLHLEYGELHSFSDFLVELSMLNCPELELKSKEMREMKSYMRNRYESSPFRKQRRPNLKQLIIKFGKCYQVLSARNRRIAKSTTPATTPSTQTSANNDSSASMEVEIIPSVAYHGIAGFVNNLYSFNEEAELEPLADVKWTKREIITPAEEEPETTITTEESRTTPTASPTESQSSTTTTTTTTSITPQPPAVHSHHRGARIAAWVSTAWRDTRSWLKEMVRMGETGRRHKRETSASANDIIPIVDKGFDYSLQAVQNFEDMISNIDTIVLVACNITVTDGMLMDTIEDEMIYWVRQADPNMVALSNYFFSGSDLLRAARKCARNYF